MTVNKVIDGKYFDTEEAEELGGIDNGYFRNDFHYYAETLYQKENGDYFIHAIGGAATDLAKRCEGNLFTGSEIIRPIGLEDAKKWVAVNFDGKRYIALFGDAD